MEYVHGDNVREMLRAQSRKTGSEGAALPLEHALAIVAGAAAGLHYAHERTGPDGEPLQIVHRDVSPSNVLVSYDGAVKLSTSASRSGRTSGRARRTGRSRASSRTCRPSSAAAKPIDRRSDVFALGSILYELTTGTAPFAGASDLDILNQIATGRADAAGVPDGGASYPPALSAIVMRALAPDPDERYPSMQALQVALEAFARDAGIALSAMALASFVQELFAEELAAWRAAQREGKSLAEHLAARPAAAPLGDGAERTATDAFASSTLSRLERRSRVRRFAAVAGFVVVCAVAGGVATKAWTQRGTGARAGTRGAETPCRPSARRGRCHRQRRCRPRAWARLRSRPCRSPPRRRRRRPRSGKQAGKRARRRVRQRRSRRRRIRVWARGTRILPCHRNPEIWSAAFTIRN